MSNTLYIVATPIGNLEDITLRALTLLGKVHVIFAEDTRVTKTLLARYGVTTPLKRYDEHVAERTHADIVSLLKKGNDVALASDAGTPSIADPGARLVAYVRKEAPDTAIVPIPGPSALMAALSVAGVSADQFTFLGYPPHKKGRETFFKNLSLLTVRPIVFYESPHRLAKTFSSLVDMLGANHEIIVAKELTKMHEEIWRGAAAAAAAYFQGKKGQGEFVIIIP